VYVGVMVAGCYSCTLRSALFYFFFQAEDGIRDRTVTGVQTCALPIFVGSALVSSGAAGVETSALPTRGRWRSRGRSARSGRRLRSEERRVGKECGSWWGRESEKEKTGDVGAVCRVMDGVGRSLLRPCC